MQLFYFHPSSLLTIVALLAFVSAEDSPLQGLLIPRDVKSLIETYGNRTVEVPGLFLLTASRENLSPIIAERQRGKCPLGSPIPCPDGLHCTTPDHSVCCPDGIYTCPTGGSCCGSGSGICAPAGSFCCSDASRHACRDGQTCCPIGCADVGNTCCGDQYQCMPDEQCCSGGKGCAPKSATCCGDVYCTSENTCCKDDDGDQFCSPGRTCVETLPLDLADYPDADEIFENMCRGIKQSDQFDPQRPNDILLSYIGKNQAKTAGQSRRDSGCAGSPCAKLFSEVGPDGKKIRWSCDEFPPASSHQGGSAAAIMRVPQKVNSATGGRWDQVVKKKSKGDQVRIKIKGLDCSGVPLDKKRSVDIGATAARLLAKRDGAILRNETDSEAIYIDGAAYGNYSDGKVAMIIPFDIPDDFIGTFNVSYTITGGTLKSGVIMDDWGEDYSSISIADKGQSSSGTVEVGPDGVGNVMMLAWADDTDVTVDYSTSLTTSTTVTSTTLTDIPSPSESLSESTSESPEPKSGVSQQRANITSCYVFVLIAYLFI